MAPADGSSSNDRDEDGPPAGPGEERATFGIDRSEAWTERLLQLVGIASDAPEALVAAAADAARDLLDAEASWLFCCDGDRRLRVIGRAGDAASDPYGPGGTVVTEQRLIEHATVDGRWAHWTDHVGIVRRLMARVVVDGETRMAVAVSAPATVSGSATTLLASIADLVYLGLQSSGPISAADRS